LNWDTGVEMSVAGDHRVVTRDINDNIGNRVAHGVGGIQTIQAIGHSDVFDINDMILIKGGHQKTDNLMAVLPEIKRRGPQHMFLFTGEGAIRWDATDAEREWLAHMMECAESEGRLVGQADVYDGAYKQDFGSGLSSKTKQINTYAATQMYAGRVNLGTTENLVGMLLSAGLSPAALKSGIEAGTIEGLPPQVCPEVVDRYVVNHGLDKDYLEATALKLPLKKPYDYVPEESNVAGEIMQIDAIDPSFSRTESTKEKKSTKVKSIGGYSDAVMAVDEATGFSAIEGRVRKKKPHIILEKFILAWLARWRTLKIIKCDKEFITEESIQMVQKVNVTHKVFIQLRQAVPNDHSRGIGKVECGNRWKQDMASMHMKRAESLVRKQVLSVDDKDRLWYHAMFLSVIGWNAKPSDNNEFMTRFEAGLGRVFNLSHFPMLPFVTELVARTNGDERVGRGVTGLYLGPSLLVRGGVMMYIPETKRVSIRYSFAAREHIPLLSNLDITFASETMYGDLSEHNVSNLVDQDEQLPAAD